MKKLLKKIKKRFFKKQKIKNNLTDLGELTLTREHLGFKSFKTPKVSIVIPFYNQENYTWACLKSLYKNLTNQHDYEIILIDDNSPEINDFSLAKNIKVIKNTTNLGFLKNINLGIKEAKGEYIYILNNDTIVQKGFLDELFYVFENYNNVGAVGSLLLNVNHSLQEAGSAFLKDFDIHNIVVGKTPNSPEVNYIYKTDYCSGCSLLFRKYKDNGDLNQFDEQFAPAYFEETDFCFDLRHNQKKEVYFTGFSKLYHYNGISYNNEKNRNQKNDSKEELFKNNKTKFYKKWNLIIDNISASNVQERITELRDNKSIVFFHTEIPRYDADSGANRLKEIMECFIKCNYQVSLIVEGTQKENPYVESYQRKGIMVYYENDNYENYNQFLKINTPKNSLVWFYAPMSFKTYYNTSKEIYTEGTFIYDMVDIHHLRMERTLELNPNDKWCKENYKVYKEIELNLNDKVDFIVTVSDSELEYMTKFYSKDKMFTVSNIHYLKVNQKQIPNFNKRKDIIFIGSTHHPNVNAVKWLVDEIMPLVWEQNSEIQLLVIGSIKNSFKKIDNMDTRIQFLGHVPDITPYFLNSKLMIAPLQIGAGVKGKIGQALEYCLPVVTTQIGAEGMFLEHEDGVLLSETSHDLADQVLRLYNNEVLWQKLSKNSEKNLYPFSKKRVIDLITSNFFKEKNIKPKSNLL